jgi:hypothetical protein
LRGTQEILYGYCSSGFLLIIEQADSESEVDVAPPTATLSSSEGFDYDENEESPNSPRVVSPFSLRTSTAVGDMSRSRDGTRARERERY